MIFTWLKNRKEKAAAEEADIDRRYQELLDARTAFRNSPAHRIDDERPLPVGMAEFNDFADRIIKLAGPYADEDSMKFALASVVIHADATRAHYSDSYFLERLRKSAANQVASQVFQDIKIKQAEQLAKQQAEATAANEAATDDTQKKD